MLDPSLLAYLPATVDGNPVIVDTDATQAAAIDPAFRERLVRIAHAYVGDPAGDNWAYTTLADVRSGELTDDFHAQWQRNLAALACTPGGATGESQVQIGGRSVDVTQCASGVIAYTARLENSSILISVMGYGELGYARIQLEAIASGS